MPSNRKIPKIPNIRKTQRIIIKTFNIPTIDYPSDEMIIFISGFLEMILKGLRVLKSFKIERSTPIVISIMAVETMKKSSLDHPFFK